MKKEILNYTQNRELSWLEFNKTGTGRSKRYYRSSSGANEIRSDFHKQSG